MSVTHGYRHLYKVELQHLCIFYWNFVKCQQEAEMYRTSCVHCETRDDPLMAPRTRAHDAVYRRMFG